MPTGPVCAYCRKQPAVTKWQPFCSERCKMTDLGRWLQGDYRISDPVDSASDASLPLDKDEDEEAQP
jgi:endogenous inhibitor of DNA gyrase (YacG/DUF329 family)